MERNFFLKVKETYGDFWIRSYIVDIQVHDAILLDGNVHLIQKDPIRIGSDLKNSVYSKPEEKCEDQ
jgi:hypothetical protein